MPERRLCRDPADGVQAHLESGNLPKYRAFTGETAAKKARRKQRAENEVSGNPAQMQAPPVHTVRPALRVAVRRPAIAGG